MTITDLHQVSLQQQRLLLKLVLWIGHHLDDVNDLLLDLAQLQQPQNVAFSH
jgi:hypothetical protein